MIWIRWRFFSYNLANFCLQNLNCIVFPSHFFMVEPLGSLNFIFLIVIRRISKKPLRFYPKRDGKEYFFYENSWMLISLCPKNQCHLQSKSLPFIAMTLGLVANNWTLFDYWTLEVVDYVRSNARYMVAHTSFIQRKWGKI